MRVVVRPKPLRLEDCLKDLRGESLAQLRFNRGFE